MEIQEKGPKSQGVSVVCGQKPHNIVTMFMCTMCFVAQSCLTLCSSMDCSPPGSSVHRDSPGENTGMGYLALLQAIFPTQESNQGLLHCRQILYRLRHQGHPGKWETK